MSNVHPQDVEKVYGALSVRYMKEGESCLSIEELEEAGFHTWGSDYLEECLERLTMKYEYVEEVDGGYRISQLEQEKHMEETYYD